MAAGPKGGIKNEINVTPLVDVVLVLLIIFMVITPMLQRGKEVTLPKASAVDDEKESKQQADPLILSITPDKKTYLEKDEYDAENLEAKLADELRNAPNRKILLKGDQSLEVGTVRKVMDITRKAGARGVALGVEQEKK